MRGQRPPSNHRGDPIACCETPRITGSRSRGRRRTTRWAPARLRRYLRRPRLSAPRRGGRLCAAPRTPDRENAWLRSAAAHNRKQHIEAAVRAVPARLLLCLLLRSSWLAVEGSREIGPARRVLHRRAGRVAGGCVGRSGWWRSKPAVSPWPDRGEDPLQVALSTRQGGPRPYAHAAERAEAFQLWRNPSSRPVRERTLSMTSPGQTAPPDDGPPPLGGRFLKPPSRPSV